MPCSVSITSVNGIVQSGQSQPTLLRVTGQVFQCTSNQVVVTSSVTAPSAPEALNAEGRFRVDLPITATTPPALGAMVGVRVECVGQETTCFAQVNEPLELCAIPTLFFQAIRPVGSLTPTQLVVQGVVQGCATDQVVVASSKTATTGPLQVDRFTGAFTTTLNFTAPVQCGEKFWVSATCVGGCDLRVDGDLSCPGCYAAEVTLTAGACTGMPATQPITFDAIISIPAGATQDFYWEFGDGAVGPTFTIDNTAGSAAAQYPNTQVHNYPPGTYTAVLKLVPPPYECTELSIQVVASCAQAGCPTIAAPAATVGAQCVNAKRTVTLTSSAAATASAAVVYWDFGDGTFSAPVSVAANTSQTLSSTHDYPPGTYTAVVRTLQPAGCPDRPVTFVVGVCTTPPCNLQILNIQTQVGPCDPANGTRTVTASAALNSSDPSDLYFWQWDATPATTGLPAPAG